MVVLKCGYGVMYSAHDGIHMPPVMSYIVGVMCLTDVFDSRCDFR